MADVGAREASGPGGVVVPPERTDWPLEPVEVLGDRDGPGARLAALAIRGLVGGATRLPRGARDALVSGLARVAPAVDRRHAQAARRYIDQAFGGRLGEDEREQLVRASYRHLLASVLEDRHIDGDLLSHPDPLALCDTSELGPVREVLTAGRGLLLATLHLGDWEAMAALGPRIGMHPFYVVSRPPRNRALSADFQRRREARGYRLIPRHGAIQTIPRIVAAGGTVALMLDQRARGKTVVAPFFGRPANCERSIAVLARRLRVPIVVGAGVAVPGGRYRLLFPRVLHAEEVAGMSPEEVMTEINRGFERMILQYPEQYLWLHDRYRKAPAAGGPDDPDEAAAVAGRAGVQAPKSGPQDPR